MSDSRASTGRKVMLARLFGPSLVEVSAVLRDFPGDDGEKPICWDEGSEVVVKCVGARVLNELFDRFGEAVYSIDGRTMEKVVAGLLAAGGFTVGTAESCTGGMVGQLLTSVAGSSGFYAGGFVTYSDVMKSRLLGVSPEILDRFGAVSEEVVRAMASGAREHLGTDVAISVSGIAGPAGGSDLKPVGMVCFGLASATGVIARTAFFKGDRQEIRTAAALCALDQVRRWCISNGVQNIVPDVAAPEGLN